MIVDETSSNYPYLNLETKWQNFWDKNKTFKTTQDTSKPKYYALDMFPFPSGEGLHVGHPEGYTATDIMCRYKRMKGFNVLHPMGWDSFGLPAENYAMKTGTHPEITTKKNIATFKRQLKSLGFSYDWEREIATSHPDYFKWTQWIFVQLYNQGLCYEDEINVNWCPNLKTVLANEEVVDGKSEVGGHPVIQKKMNQWMLKITKYAERLLVDLEDLDWPESIKEMQRNWIGKSVGARISFDVDGADSSSIEVFTTRPDTLFGATYLVLAPEHPLVQKITKPSMKSEIDRYTLECQKKNDLERTELNKNKTGVFTGSYAIHPLTKEKIPVWIADYVLTTYGTGAIMSVPAHDTRDHEFALKFQLKIIPVIELPEGESLPYTKDGKHINSQFLNGLNNQAAIKKMLDYLEEKKIGKSETNYKLRDWIFSRQRYWGEPFPILKFEDGTIRLLDEDELPLKLPAMEKFEPSGTGESPLLNADEWLNIIDPKTKKKARRETNTMPNWAGSCWYYLRFIDPRNEDSFVDPTSEKYWMPVDLYVGGAEHAVLHLLYARFWHKVLYDLGFVSTKEPFKKLVNQGLILAEDGEKMSKSRGNVVNPDHIVAEFGGDSLRLYEMFMGPIDKVKPWKTDGVKGVFNFLNRAYRFLTDKEKTNASEDSEETIKLLHKTIKKVTHDYEGMHFNTAISSLMIFLNHLYKVGNITPATAQIFIKLLYPMAPHLGEELYSKFNPTVATITYETWPLYNEALTIDDTVTIAISVNGKLRGTINVNRDISSDEVLALAKKEENIARNLQGLTLVKEIYVPGKIVNFVAKN